MTDHAEFWKAAEEITSKVSKAYYTEVANDGSMCILGALCTAAERCGNRVIWIKQLSGMYAENRIEILERYGIGYCQQTELLEENDNYEAMSLPVLLELAKKKAGVKSEWGA